MQFLPEIAFRNTVTEFTTSGFHGVFYCSIVTESLFRSTVSINSSSRVGKTNAIRLMPRYRSCRPEKFLGHVVHAFAFFNGIQYFYRDITPSAVIRRRCVPSAIYPQPLYSSYMEMISKFSLQNKSKFPSLILEDELNPCHPINYK